ncbi:phosphoglycolate phosphatase [Chromohalobacter marismortui]|uniref:Phosphoglycolate phosphatase n=1 Tax=Chromohalobacter marismortui TaxID=42055 RepID=A0A4R7NR92_9GAMM|nr:MULTISPECIES: phosphoglycolate phosphatase [Chromohalobacter]MCI0508671.1 phosphoglycolate phosphatase [Chromohalobacter sp.]MCI0593475.1 phosphoglycolate phosphatase [Chromohalobacter sp.]TDU23149.1 phosphoglycolate phosphatase [Chromohalobacter marismortui]
MPSSATHPALEGIRLVVFDLDGTLIDSVPDLAAAVDGALRDMMLPEVGEAAVRDWVGNGSRKLVERALQAVGARGGELDAAHDLFLHHYRLAPCRATQVYPGVRDALEALAARGMRMGLVTNKPTAFIAPILECLDLAHYFSLTLGGDALSTRKPDPAPLLHLAAHLDVAPSACLMVGDSRHDVEAGRRAGFRTLAVPYGYNHGEPVAASGPDVVVESLRELV